MKILLTIIYEIYFSLNLNDFLIYFDSYLFLEEDFGFSDILDHQQGVCLDSLFSYDPFRHK